VSLELIIIVRFFPEQPLEELPSTNDLHYTPFDRKTTVTSAYPIARCRSESTELLIRAQHRSGIHFLPSR
jgi:hypothetical protein